VLDRRARARMTLDVRALYQFLELLLTYSQIILWTEFWKARWRPMYGQSLFKATIQASTVFRLFTPHSKARLEPGS
jgi:hypothetical protein